MLCSFVVSLVSVNSWAETTVTFAVDPTFPPMEFEDSDKAITGFSIDFIKAVGKNAGFTPVFVKVPWKDIFTGLETGKYDAICSSVSVTPKRIKKWISHCHIFMSDRRFWYPMIAM